MRICNRHIKVSTLPSFPSLLECNEHARTHNVWLVIEYPFWHMNRLFFLAIKLPVAPLPRPVWPISHYSDCMCCTATSECGFVCPTTHRTGLSGTFQFVQEQRQDGRRVGAGSEWVGQKYKYSSRL